MESFVSKHPIALTIIFSYVISPSRCDVQNGSCSFVTNFISLNRSILDAFDNNDAFWMWFIKYTFDCKTCIEDVILLRSVTAQMIPDVNEKFCFWKRECKVQMATRRLRRQWSLKFAGRVLTHNYVPIIWESDSTRQLTVFRSSKTNASGKVKQEGKAPVTAAATISSPAELLFRRISSSIFNIGRKFPRLEVPYLSSSLSHSSGFASVRIIDKCKVVPEITRAWVVGDGTENIEDNIGIDSENPMKTTEFENKNFNRSDDNSDENRIQGKTLTNKKEIIRKCRDVVISENTVFALLDQFLMAEIKVLQGGKRESKHCHIGIDQLFEKIKRKEKEKIRENAFKKNSENSSILHDTLSLENQKENLNESDNHKSVDEEEKERLKEKEKEDAKKEEMLNLLKLCQWERVKIIANGDKKEEKKGYNSGNKMEIKRNKERKWWNRGGSFTNGRLDELKQMIDDMKDSVQHTDKPYSHSFLSTPTPIPTLTHAHSFPSNKYRNNSINENEHENEKVENKLPSKIQKQKSESTISLKKIIIPSNKKNENYEDTERMRMKAIEKRKKLILNDIIPISEKRGKEKEVLISNLKLNSNCDDNNKIEERNEERDCGIRNKFHEKINAENNDNKYYDNNNNNNNYAIVRIKLENKDQKEEKDGKEDKKVNKGHKGVPIKSDKEFNRLSKEILKSKNKNIVKYNKNILKNDQNNYYDTNSSNERNEKSKKDSNSTRSLHDVFENILEGRDEVDDDSYFTSKDKEREERRERQRERGREKGSGKFSIRIFREKEVDVVGREETEVEKEEEEEEEEEEKQEDQQEEKEEEYEDGEDEREDKDDDIMWYTVTVRSIASLMMILSSGAAVEESEKEGESVGGGKNEGEEGAGAVVRGGGGEAISIGGGTGGERVLGTAAATTTGGTAGVTDSNNAPLPVPVPLLPHQRRDILVAVKLFPGPTSTNSMAMAARVSGVAVLPPSAGNVRSVRIVGNIQTDREGQGGRQGEGEGGNEGGRQGEEGSQGQGQGQRMERQRRGGGGGGGGESMWNQRNVWGNNNSNTSNSGWGHNRRNKDKDTCTVIRRVNSTDCDLNWLDLLTLPYHTHTQQ